jgi:hypothetical protein
MGDFGEVCGGEWAIVVVKKFDCDAMGADGPIEMIFGGFKIGEEGDCAFEMTELGNVNLFDAMKFRIPM